MAYTMRTVNGTLLNIQEVDYDTYHILLEDDTYIGNVQGYFTESETGHWVATYTYDYNEPTAVYSSFRSALRALANHHNKTTKGEY